MVSALFWSADARSFVLCPHRFPSFTLRLPEAQQAVIDVNDGLRDTLDDLSMAAIAIVSRSIDQTTGDRVEVDLENDAIEVALFIDRCPPFLIALRP